MRGLIDRDDPLIGGLNQETHTATLQDIKFMIKYKIKVWQCAHELLKEFLLLRASLFKPTLSSLYR